MECPYCKTKMNHRLMMCLRCGRMFRTMEDGTLMEIERKKTSPERAIKKDHPIEKVGDIPFEEIYEYYLNNRKNFGEDKNLNFAAALTGPFWYFYQNELLLGTLNILLYFGLILVLPIPGFIYVVTLLVGELFPLIGIFLTLLYYFCFLAIFNLLTATPCRNFTMKKRLLRMHRHYKNEDIGKFFNRLEQKLYPKWYYLLLNFLISVGAITLTFYLVILLK